MSLLGVNDLPPIITTVAGAGPIQVFEQQAAWEPSDTDSGYVTVFDSNAISSPASLTPIAIHGPLYLTMNSGASGGVVANIQVELNGVVVETITGQGLPAGNAFFKIGPRSINETIPSATPKAFSSIDPTISFGFNFGTARLRVLVQVTTNTLSGSMNIGAAFTGLVLDPLCSIDEYVQMGVVGGDLNTITTGLQTIASYSGHGRLFGVVPVQTEINTGTCSTELLLIIDGQTVMTISGALSVFPPFKYFGLGALPFSYPQNGSVDLSDQPLSFQGPNIQFYSSVELKANVTAIGGSTEASFLGGFYIGLFGS